ncbi:DUF6087 family protein [Streptomyces sp. NPDC057686]|uniref:DUF6087 family protein n=1 Tax=Streptomyces sp. NPDC057686 TaxID=3346212 RepID=UPI0036AD1DF5
MSSCIAFGTSGGVRALPAVEPPVEPDDHRRLSPSGLSPCPTPGRAAASRLGRPWRHLPPDPICRVTYRAVLCQRVRNARGETISGRLLAVTEEPFEEWAANLLARRAARVGTLRALPMDGSAGRGAHVNPTAPRLMARWDGYRWVPETVAADYAAAQRMLHGISAAKAEPASAPPGQALPRPTGRHRKPPAP